MSLKHHTAIVSAVEENGKRLRFFHQNFASKRYVIDGSINLEDLKSGWLRIYRPLPK